MNSDNISDYKIYDGNGKPFDLSLRYFNRYQSTLRHDLVVRSIKPCKYKTYGGFVDYRPVAYCSFEYYGNDGRITRNSGRFEGEYIAKNIYGFPQLIPVDEGITLDFEYCQSGAYRDAVLELWKKANPEALKEAEDAEAEAKQQALFWCEFNDAEKPEKCEEPAHEYLLPKDKLRKVIEDNEMLSPDLGSCEAGFSAFRQYYELLSPEDQKLDVDSLVNHFDEDLKHFGAEIFGTPMS